MFSSHSAPLKLHETSSGNAPGSSKCPAARKIAFKSIGMILSNSETFCSSSSSSSSPSDKSFKSVESLESRGGNKKGFSVLLVCSPAARGSRRRPPSTGVGRPISSLVKNQAAGPPKMRAPVIKGCSYAKRIVRISMRRTPALMPVCSGVSCVLLFLGVLGLGWRFSLISSSVFMNKNECSYLVPFAFETAWVLVAFVLPNHRVSLCSGSSLAFRRRASSITLGI